MKKETKKTHIQAEIHEQIAKGRRLNLKTLLKDWWAQRQSATKKSDNK